MMNKAIIEPRKLKGFRDFGPQDMSARKLVFGKIQKAFESFGFLPMSTPVLEYKEVLMNKYGEDEKLVYGFTDNGGREVAMRYDLTVPLARFVAENQNTLTYPFKRYQVAPVWRADNPQKGRFREFFQCDIDIVGATSKLADAEVMACICKALEAVGVEEYELRLNDRRIFSVFGKDSAAEVIRSVDKLGKIGEEGVIAELKSKSVSSETLEKVEWLLGLAKAEDGKPGEILMQAGLKEVWDDLYYLQATMKALGVEWVKMKFDPTIARGLDYYTSTVFEVVLKNAPDFGSIAAGGRYDTLVDAFSKTSVPAVGGSIGVDRLFDALRETGSIEAPTTVQALVINQDASLATDYLGVARQLRNAGINAELYYEPVKLDKQFKYAESKNIPWAVILGEDEKARGVVKLKNLATRDQQEVAIADAVSLLNA